MPTKRATLKNNRTTFCQALKYIEAMLIVEPHYFPSIIYFASLLGQDKILLEGKENYVKQTYRNRCYIKAANKVDRLSVPVQGNEKMCTDQIRIDYSQRWQSVHYKAITSAYSHAPFFEIFIPDFEAIIFKKHEFLIDLNVEILTLCLKYLRLKTLIDITSVYQIEYEKDVLDFRNTFYPDNQSLTVDFPRYTQIFGNTFVNNLSIIDLLFCVGNQTWAYLKEVNQSLLFKTV